MTKKIKPDLIIERESLGSSEGVEFYKSTDGFLEIRAWNFDSDSFTIILDPNEVRQLKELVKD